MKRLRSLQKLLCLGLLATSVPFSVPPAKAQTCSDCGWSEGSGYETYRINYDVYCAYYYETYDYYYCGQYEFSQSFLLYEECF
jgi:hypothetical protein